MRIYVWCEDALRSCEMCDIINSLIMCDTLFVWKQKITILVTTFMILVDPVSYMDLKVLRNQIRFEYMQVERKRA